MMGLAILILLTVTMAALAYWAGGDPGLDAGTLRLYRDAELAARGTAQKKKEAAVKARERGRRIVQGSFAVPKGTGAKGSR